MTPILRLVPSFCLALLAGASGPVAAADAAPGGAAAPAPTMKVVRFHALGGPEVLVYEDVPRPRPGPGELLIRVHAAGVNPVDWKIRKLGRGVTLPHVPGSDVSGVVVAVGRDVTRFAVGDAVFAFLPADRGGGYAEYAVVPEGQAAPKPASVDHVHAAAIPLAGLTAWQALFDHAHLQAGQTVLIHGAAGGVGSFAVQFAKAKGATVIATASGKNLPFLKEIGADRGVDYTKERFEDVVHGVDVVFDTVGGDTLERSFLVLRPGGTVVSIGGDPSAAVAAHPAVRVLGMHARPDAGELSGIAALVVEGKVRPIVTEILPLAEARRAQEASETRHTRGKIVLRVAD